MFVAVSATAMVALSACGSNVSPAGGSVTSSDGPALPSRQQADSMMRSVGPWEASIPGAIVGIWGPAGDYVRTFGVADKATHTPMQTDFYSRIGSLTKTFTVTAMLQLVDQGKLEAQRSDLEVRSGRAFGRPDNPARAGPNDKRPSHIRRRGGVRRLLHRRPAPILHS